MLQKELFVSDTTNVIFPPATISPPPPPGVAGLPNAGLLVLFSYASPELNSSTKKLMKARKEKIYIINNQHKTALRRISLTDITTSSICKLLLLHYVQPVMH
jgi:hypothetical protein